MWKPMQKICNPWASFSRTWLIVSLLSLRALAPMAQLRAEDEGSFFTGPAGQTEPVSAAASGSAEGPARTPVIPPGRPEWLVNADAREPGNAWAIVTAGPHPTLAECEEELSEQIKQATDHYVNELTGSPLAANLLKLRGADLKSRLAGSTLRYEETVQVSFGPRQQIHARLQFSDDFQREILRRWREISQYYRLLETGLVSAVLLGLLATASGYFQAQRSRPGKGTLGLQFLAGGAILVIVVAGVAAAKLIYWL